MEKQNPGCQRLMGSRVSPVLDTRSLKAALPEEQGHSLLPEVPFSTLLLLQESLESGSNAWLETPALL